MNNLKEYNAKRNFSKTKEPKGIKQSSHKKLKFVVQHHYASKEHYDLRLEFNGVYVSFAIPKGPSFNPKDKRLAVKVENHPLSYGTFEGIIPEGEYGAGTVMLWDKGYWYPNQKPNFKKGPIKFILNGQRLKGAWTLIPFKDNNWLLIKEKDDYINKIDIFKYKTSIKTGRVIEQITNSNVINVTHPEKIIFKKAKITKKQIIDYYQLVINKIMPFLDNRLISVVRSPNGVDKDKFYMKHLSTSKDLGKKKIKEASGKYNYYYYIKNPIGLLNEVQMNSYEFHIWGSKQNSINHPDILVFDLDPDENLAISKVRQGAKDLKKILDELNLKSFIKTSGGKGYHIFVPIKVSSYNKLEKIAQNISTILVEKYPDKYTTNIRKNSRKNKIFIDYFRNKQKATSVCPYSLRLKEKATISFPISWHDLDKIKPDSITIKNVKKYLAKKDPWDGFFEAYL